MLTRPIPPLVDEGDVQAFTGYFAPAYVARQWDRGVLYRVATPRFSLGPFWPMFDPSQPDQYNQGGGTYAG